ncbi:MAG: hypothetical protein HY205_02755 [Nitrospirae bacterium]|nr:hypothetical protein [Nitrospirota bacterium]
MEIRFQPALLQEVIDSFVEKTEREGDPTYYKEFHELADPIYERFTLDDREAEFKKLYQYFFGTWGFSDIIRDAFEEFPSLKERVGIVLIKGVLKEDQEGVDILRKWGSVEQDLAKQFEDQGLKGVGIKLIPRRFYDPALTRYCRHELMHISDMLDPVFNYDPDTKVGQNPGEETLILHRYRVLWCQNIDSRLIRIGKESMLSREDRFKEFRSWYRKIPPAQLKSVFEGLWQSEMLTHAELIEMASDTVRVMDRALDIEGGEVPDVPSKVMLMPGFPCPLCRFPTYSWVEDLEQKLEKHVLEFIRENHPGWDTEFGACDRCVEVYKLRADGVM